MKKSIAKYYLIYAIFTVMFILLEFAFFEKITTIIGVTLWGISFTLILIIVTAIFSHKLTEYELKEFKNIQDKRIEEAKNYLTSEFKPVLGYPSDIVNDLRKECEAKICDDGKILCKISYEFDSVDEFARFFWTDSDEN